MSARVSIIVLCRNQWADTQKCLESLRRRTDPKRYEVLAYDNDSTDETPARLSELAREWPQLRVFRNRQNMSFARAVNRGMRSARGKYFLWLNNDTELTQGWLEALLEGFEKGADIAAVGPMTDHMAPPQQLSGPFKNGDGRNGIEAAFLGGFCFLVKRSAAARVGALDERFSWGWEDMDFCLRLRQSGLRLILKQDVFVHHRGNRTLDTMVLEERKLSDSSNRDLMRRKWMPLIPFWEDVRELFEQFPPISESGLPKVSILIVCDGNPELAGSCLDSIRANAVSRSYEALAVCLGHDEELLRGLNKQRSAWPELRIVKASKSLAWAQAVNRALGLALGEHFLIVDSRTLAGPNCIDRLLDSLGREPNLGMAGPKTNGAALHWQDVPVPENLSAAEYKGMSERFSLENNGKTREAPYLKGCFFAVPRRVYERVGPFDHRFRGSVAAVDFCLRAIQAGYRALVAEDAFAYLRPRVDGTGNIQDSLLLLSKWTGHPAFHAASS